MDFISVLRQFRIGPFTVFDTLLAYVGIYLVAPILSKLFLKFNINISRTSWLWLTLPIGVIFHLILNQNTPFTNMFLDQNGGYLSKIILILMLYMGLRNIKKLPIQASYTIPNFS